jgi:tRNA threonylcarbamoyladenosine biosynthesis protein TsaB
MSYILAIDTSTDACSVAILTPSGVKQILTIAPREHTQRLLPSVERLLAEHGLSLRQFDAIAFGVGPGSFTGLRIGLSTAQGLAYGADLPLIPISTLQTMAQTAIRLEHAGASQMIIPVIDARMSEVYCAAYHYDARLQKAVAVEDECIIAPEALCEMPWFTNSKDVVGVGSGWHYPCFSSDASSTDQSRSIIIEAYPEAYDMAVLAKLALEQEGDDVAVSPLAAVPTYMRDEISWKKRQRIREKTA